MKRKKIQENMHHAIAADSFINKRLFAIPAIIAVTFILYMPAISGGFIWDDDSFVTNNSLIKATNGLERFWFSTEPPDYFPLTSTTLWLEWRLWGMQPTGYHVTNLFLHILIAVLIGFILKRLKIPLAWLAAFIFAIHPVNVESVAWITQRKSTLSMVFYCLSILWYLRFDETDKPIFYKLSLGSFVLALLSKTSIIMAPLVLLGCAWWKRKKIEREDVRRTIPFFVTSFILSIITVWFQYNRSIGSDIVRTDSFFSRLAGAGWNVWFYLYKALVPLRLNFVYPRWDINPAFFASYIPGILLVGLLFLFWRYRNSWGRPFLFGIGYFVVMLFPVLGFLNIYYFRYSYVADHYQYPAIIGIIAIVTGLGGYVFERSSNRIRYFMTGILVLVLSFLCFRTFNQARIYKNGETVFRDTLRKDPSCWMANYNLGHFLQDEGRFDEAIAYYLKAFYIDLTNPDPLNNIGNVLLKERKVDQAISYFRWALRIRPNFGECHYNLACALSDTGKYTEAINHFYRAIQIQPKNAKAHNNLANTLVSQSRAHEALAHYKEAIRLNPGFVDAYVNMGIVLRQQKKYQEAFQYFTEALRIEPSNEKARNNIQYIHKLTSGKAG